MKQLFCPALLLTISIFAGCNGSKSDQTVQSGTQPETTAPATKPVVVDGVGTEPAQAVAVFLDSLRRGDETAANSMLTSLARDQVLKTNFQIEPPGTPDGKYQIGRVGFPYPEKTVALVECQWSEPGTAGAQPEVVDIVCEVHQEAEGWRIAGLVFKVSETEDALVLDFENAASLQATLEGATSAPATPAAGAPAQQNQIALPPINNAPTLR